MADTERKPIGRADAPPWSTELLPSETSNRVSSGGETVESGHARIEPEKGDVAPREEFGAAQVPQARIGSMLQQYELIRSLGRGGMGEVFLARDNRLDRLVAIKVLSQGGQAVERLVAEARATAQFNHENIVVLYDIGQHAGFPYMVLEYLKGKTLREWLSRPPSELGVSAKGGRTASGYRLPPLRIVEIMIPVVRALVCAHDRGIVHRDLKPTNIMLTDTGGIKVLDFGVAKLVASKPFPALDSAELESKAPRLSVEQTAAGTLVGTLPYMSPEQWRADSVDYRADIWAVGIMMAEMALGHHPLWPLSNAILATVRDLDVPMPLLRELSPDLGKLGSIIDRCLIKSSEDRLGTALELLAELESLAPATRGVAPDDANPYAGLTAFQQGDENRFFGRSRAITQVITRLSEQPLLAIIGSSGAGKSSFVRAGVIPALKHTRDAWESFVIRPGVHPLSALAELLLAHSWDTSNEGRDSLRSIPPSGAPDRASLRVSLRERPGYLGAQMRARARRKLTNILLFVDQFEEVYTLASEDERATFFACLAGVADDVGSALRVVIAFRSDFVDRVAEAHASMTGLSRGVMLLSPLDRQGLREALVRPVEAVGYRFEHPRLVDEMLDTLEHVAGALPLLQFTAASLWEQRDRERHVLTEASYREMGGIAGALALHADAVLAAMSQPERKLARLALLRLVTPERTRALATIGELSGLAEAPEAMQRVLACLVDARLLTVESNGSEDATVELIHESLIASWPTLSRWLHENQDNAASLARVRIATREWQAGGEAEELLWRGQPAREAERWLELSREEISQTERRYLEAVVARLGRAKRKRRAMIVGTVALSMTIAAGMSYLAARAQTEATRAQTEAARAQTEATRARDVLRVEAARQSQDDPTTVLALLREIEDRQPPRGWGALAKLALDMGVARSVLLGHAEGVVSAAWSPDGRRVASASTDKTVRVWNADGSGAPLVLRGHTDGVHSVAFSPDGKRIVSASWDKTVRVWNADGSGAPLILRGHLDRVLSVAFSPDGKRIVSGSEDKTVRVWNADGSGAPVILEGHPERVMAVAFSPGGERVASGSADKTVRIWNADGTGEPIVLRHSDGVLSVAFSPDGKRIVSSSWGTTVRVWNANGTGAPLILEGHSERVDSVAFSPDGERIVSASWDKTLRVWKADGSGSPIVFQGHSDRVMAAAFSPDGNRLVSASADRSVRVWNAEGTGALLVLRGHSDTVKSAAFSPDGKRIASCSYDRTVRVWNADGSGAALVLRGHSDGVYSVAFSPDNRRIVSASGDKTVRIWNADGTGVPIVLTGHTDIVSWAAWSPDGKRVVSASWDKTVRIWNADGTGDPIVLQGHSAEVASAAFSPDGERIASASIDRTVRIWNADGTGEPVVLQGHTERVYSAAWSPDGKRIVSASWDKTARIWNANGTGVPLVLEGLTEGLTSAAWSPDGKRIVAASRDKTVRIWNADRSGTPVVLEGLREGATSATFSPDGTRIVAGSRDKTVRVWNNLDAIAPDDPRLWSATTYCMPVAERRRLLHMSDELARAHRDACLRRVANAGGASF